MTTMARFTALDGIALTSCIAGWLGMAVFSTSINDSVSSPALNEFMATLPGPNPQEYRIFITTRLDYTIVICLVFLSSLLFVTGHYFLLSSSRNPAPSPRRLIARGSTFFGLLGWYYAGVRAEELMLVFLPLHEWFGAVVGMVIEAAMPNRRSRSREEGVEAARWKILDEKSGLEVQ